MSFNFACFRASSISFNPYVFFFLGNRLILKFIICSGSINKNSFVIEETHSPKIMQ
ncbi:hypothetical protein GIB67_029426, partial [Kingdonia uniflora]